MSKQIFTVFACDQWKSRNSMRLMMATTSVRKLKSFIVRKIIDKTFTYDKGDEAGQDGLREWSAGRYQQLPALWLSGLLL